MKWFNFGENWLKYSEMIGETEIKEAEESLKTFFENENIEGKKFLDIGCGSGLFSIAAKNLYKGKVVGIDISDESIKSSILNKNKILPNEDIEFKKISVLGDDFKDLGTFDVVYSWGVLHHTGNMYKAIENSMNAVAGGGILSIAIYNKHWSSFFWKQIKYLYNISPQIGKNLLICIFYPIILSVKFLVTFENPLKMRRGMIFYYNIVDWLGGYPYEYASKEEIKSFVENKGFKLVKFTNPKVPISCNEYMFKKNIL